MAFEGDRNYLTVKKMAALIGKSYLVTLNMCKDGKIKAIPVGGTFRIYEEEVNRFLIEGNHPHPTPARLR